MYSQNSNSEIVVNFVHRRKSNLIKVLGNKCCICGFDKFQQALEFHHVNPEEKEFGIGASNAVTKALDKQLEEMKKCILVCSNCHRGIHSGYYQVPSNWKTFYDNKIAEALLEDLKAKETVCVDCGKKISSSANRCPECAKIYLRACVRPSREELKILIRTMPFTQIGIKYKVSDNAVRKWCDIYGLPKKKSEINAYSEEEWSKL